MHICQLLCIAATPSTPFYAMLQVRTANRVDLQLYPTLA